MNMFKCGKTESIILSPYAVFAINEYGKVNRQRYGIRNAAACDERALEYAREYGAHIET